MCIPLTRSVAGATPKKVLETELNAIRETHVSADAETLLLLDLLEGRKETATVEMMIALQISAQLAAAAGLTKKQWLQQLLTRHASEGERVELLWHALVELHNSSSLPW